MKKELLKIKLGSMIRVDDVDLIVEELHDIKKTPDFLLKSRVVLGDPGSEVIILTLDHIGTDLEYLLVCETFGDLLDSYLYQRPSFFTPDKRSIIQESDNSWLFDGDGHPDEIYNDDIVYTRKLRTEVYGDVVMIVWETPSQIVDYRLLLLETGFKHNGGGWVEFYTGRQISNDDITLTI